MRVCFSFAAYAKSLIHHLSSTLHIPIQPGLSESEFHQIETSLNFKFPPDLRSILRETLPVGPGFPNWRSASKQQLRLLLNLPLLKLVQSVQSRTKKGDVSKTVSVLKNKLKSAPILIPIYKGFYIPSNPDLVGNPVFEVGETIRIAGFDLGGFFAEFSEGGVGAPAWRAREARRIGTWTDLAEGGGGKWCRGGEIGERMEEAVSRLRSGGWGEDEVREMMGMDGWDGVDLVDFWGKGEMDGRDFNGDKMRRLGEVLIGSGWCVEDVVYALDLQHGTF